MQVSFFCVFFVSKDNLLDIYKQYGLSEPEFNDDLVCKFRKIVGKTIVSLNITNIVTRYKKDRLQHRYSAAYSMHDC